MAYLGPVQRWDIFWADLDPVVGREQAGKRRPVLVVSSDELSNSTQRLVMAVPLSSLEGKTREFLSYEIPLPTGLIDPGKTPVALTQQIRSLSSLRLYRYAGRLEAPRPRQQIEEALLTHLGITFYRGPSGEVVLH
ncbi:MAG TPA: type II toxin-antitoxin system PemK/MazF family toxin [Longimicrobiaceae bacterium]|nr:type II toxin-antitoxin system PemK/MazF family toxin [Longimicrobiaceae bacterium]